jgi:hypothetical protein
MSAVQQRPAREPIWMVHDLTTSLTKGTTLPVRFYMALSMILYGAGFFANQGSWLFNPTFATMNNFIKLEHWGALYLVIGMLGMWRVLARKSNIWCAWIINTSTFLVWVSSVIIRFWGIGTPSLGSLHTAYLFMAFWILLRTEANSRDRETS